MPLKPCPECGRKVSDRAASCPSCGVSLRRSHVGWLLAILALVAVAAAGFWAIPRAVPEEAALVVTPPEPEVVLEQLTNQQKLAVRQVVRRSSLRVDVAHADGSIVSGSGVVLQRMGPGALILTNAHVVSGDGSPASVTVTAAETRDTVAAYVVRVIEDGADQDYALLLAEDPNTLLGPPVELATEIEQGAYVVAVGNPLGEEFLVDDGYVAAVEKTASGHRLMHDALIESGSSGGGLFDSKGRLVGINTVLGEDGQTAVALFNRALLEGTKAYWVRVDARADWQDSGILYDAAQHAAQIVAIGQWKIGSWKGSTSAGGFPPEDGNSVDRELPHGGLMVQIGRSAPAIAVDEDRDGMPADRVRALDLTPSQPGVLRFRANDAGQGDNDGFLDVFVVLEPVKL